MTDRISHLVERSQKIWAETLDRSVDDLATAKHDPLNTMPALTQLTRDYIDQPQKLVEATLEYWTQQTDLWTNIVQRSLGGEDTDPVATPEPGDKRFMDEMWSNNPYFDYLKQSYLLTGNWLKGRLADAEGLSPHDRRKLEFLTRNYIEAISPTNYAATNPEVAALLRQNGREEGRHGERVGKVIEILGLEKSA